MGDTSINNNATSGRTELPLASDTNANTTTSTLSDSPALKANEPAAPKAVTLQSIKVLDVKKEASQLEPKLNNWNQTVYKEGDPAKGFKEPVLKHLQASFGDQVAQATRVQAIEYKTADGKTVQDVVLYGTLQKQPHVLWDSETNVPLDPTLFPNNESPGFAARLFSIVMPFAGFGVDTTNQKQANCLTSMSVPAFSFGARVQGGPMLSDNLKLNFFGSVEGYYRWAKNIPINSQNDQCPQINEQGPERSTNGETSDAMQGSTGMEPERQPTTGEGSGPPPVPGGDTDGDGKSDGTVRISDRILENYRLQDSLGARVSAGAELEFFLDQKHKWSLGAGVAAFAGAHNFINERDGIIPLQQDKYGRAVFPTSINLELGVTPSLRLSRITPAGRFSLLSELSLMDRKIDNTSHTTGQEADDVHLSAWSLFGKLAWNYEEATNRSPSSPLVKRARPSLKTCEPCDPKQGKKLEAKKKEWLAKVYKEGVKANGFHDDEMNKRLLLLYGKEQVDSLEIGKVSFLDRNKKPVEDIVMFFPDRNGGKPRVLWDDVANAPMTPEGLMGRAEANDQYTKVANATQENKKRFEAAGALFGEARPDAAETKALLATTSSDVFDQVLAQLNAARLSKGKPALILDVAKFQTLSNEIVAADKNPVDAIIHEYDIDIHGITNTRGSDAYNLGLSDRRADVMHHYLTLKGHKHLGESYGTGETAKDLLCDYTPTAIQQLADKTLEGCHAANRAFKAEYRKRGDPARTGKPYLEISKPALPEVMSQVPTDREKLISLAIPQIEKVPQPAGSDKACAQVIGHQDYVNTDGETPDADKPSIETAAASTEPDCMSCSDPAEPPKPIEPGELNMEDIGRAYSLSDDVEVALKGLQDQAKDQTDPKAILELLGKTRALQATIFTQQAGVEKLRLQVKANVDNLILLNAAQKDLANVGAKDIETLDKKLNDLRVKTEGLIAQLSGTKKVEAVKSDAKSFTLPATAGAPDYVGPAGGRQYGRGTLFIKYEGKREKTIIVVNKATGKPINGVKQLDAQKMITVPFSANNSVTFGIYEVVDPTKPPVKLGEYALGIVPNGNGKFTASAGFSETGKGDTLRAPRREPPPPSSGETLF